MSTRVLSRNEQTICLFMLGFMVLAAGTFGAIRMVADETPYRLCFSTVSIMTTTGHDITCN